MEYKNAQNLILTTGTLFLLSSSLGFSSEPIAFDDYIKTSTNSYHERRFAPNRHPFFKDSLMTNVDKGYEYKSQNQTLVSESESIAKAKEYMEVELVQKIEEVFGEKVSEFWTPTMDLLDRSCLFVSFVNQNELEKKYGDDLGFELYLRLKDELEENKFFDMVALL